MLKVGLTIPIIVTLSVQPSVMSWFPISGQAKRSVDGKSYNPNGKQDETFVYGINWVAAF